MYSYLITHESLLNLDLIHKFHVIKGLIIKKDYSLDIKISGAQTIRLYTSRQADTWPSTQ